MESANELQTGDARLQDFFPFIYVFVLIQKLRFFLVLSPLAPASNGSICSINSICKLLLSLSLSLFLGILKALVFHSAVMLHDESHALLKL